MSGQLNLGFKLGSVGTKVSFKKLNYADPYQSRDILIPGVLEIARQNNGGLYNAALQTNWNGSGPTNTEWNTQFVDPANTDWSNLWDIENRNYDTWYDAIETPEGQNAPPLYVGMCSILHETTTDSYWLIKFTDWTVGGNGGGFAYDRWRIPSPVVFERGNYQPWKVDNISKGVRITRKNDYGQIYNKVNENEANTGVSPKNTRWNSEYTDSRPGYSGFTDLSNVEKRVYTDFASALDGQVGNNIIGTELVMHDLTTDLYYKFEFSSWTSNGNGGGFEYTRTVIPQSNPIVFGDGSQLLSSN
jgi:hypothetical protein